MILAHAARPLALFVLTLILVSVSPALFAQSSGPMFIGQVVTAPIPTAEDESVIVHLRQQGVVAGDAPVAVYVEQVFVDGQPLSDSGFVYTTNLGDSFGSVCLVVEYPRFPIEPTSSITLELSAWDMQERNANAIVTLANGPAMLIDPEDPAQAAMCADQTVLSQPPAVQITGGSRTVADSDGVPGESVTLTANATDPDGTISSYEWFLGEELVGNESSVTLQLADGASPVAVRVTDNTGQEAWDEVVITVTQAQDIVVNAGESRSIPDSDGESGEMVELTGSASVQVGTIVSYEWYRDGEEPLGTGQTINVFLEDGTHTVTLVATSSTGQVGYASIEIAIGEAITRTLAELPGLTPSQRRLAAKLDDACRAVVGDGDGEGDGGGEGDGADLAFAARGAGAAAVHGKRRPPTEEEMADFAMKCRGLLFNSNTGQLVDAMGELLGDDFAVARTQTLVFANTQYTSVMDRLIALRGGAKGLSLAGLNIMVDGKFVPLAELQSLAKTLFGSGASADSDGGLLSDKWGLWMRGNYSFGEKDADARSPRFKADQYAIVGGVDYRFNANTVAGVSLAYGNASIDFDPSSEGGLDTESWAVSLYGSVYAARNFYFDGIVNIADSDYDARRNISYVDGFGLVDADARGDTGGLTMSAGLSGGYDLSLGRLTLSPNFGVFYVDTQIDEFTEYGAGGLNLIYDEQKFKSLTGNLGLRATLAWNLSWGVLLPHLRADFVREFEDDVHVFGVRFAADPNATSTPPILVETDNQDSSYWRFAGGVSAQFKFGVSGYVEYQRLESMESLSFEDVSLGLRFQRSF